MAKQKKLRAKRLDHSKKAQLFRWFAIVFSIAIGMIVILIINPALGHTLTYSNNHVHNNVNLHRTKMEISIWMKMPIVSNDPYFKDKTLTYAETIDLLAHNVDDPDNKVDKVFCDIMKHDLYLFSRYNILTITFPNESMSKNFECGERNGNSREIKLGEDSTESDPVVFEYPSMMPNEIIQIKGQ